MRTWIALGIAAALLCAVVVTVLAEPDCTVVHCVYLASVLSAPTMTPTPIPEPLSTLVLQPSDVRSGYVRDTNMEITNAAAAATYPNPAAALQAFEAQGREDAWFVRYSSSDYIFSDAVAVGNETYRYLTIAGATQGQAFTIAKTKKDNPTYQSYDQPVLGYPAISLKRTFTSNGTKLVLFYVSVQVGRYVTDVQVGGLESVVGTPYIYALRAVSRLHNTPQSTHHDGTTPTPDTDAVRDTLTIH